MKQSFYCGDAAGKRAFKYLLFLVNLFLICAGRRATPTKKKDFSCSDRKFAANVGLTFHTPEVYFLGESDAPFDWDGFNPMELMNKKLGWSFFPPLQHYSPR